MKAKISILFFSTFLMSCAASQTCPQSTVSERSQSTKTERALPKTETAELNEKQASSINAQDIIGEWLGTLEEAGKKYRFAFYIAKKPEGDLFAIWYNPDRAGWSFSVYSSSVTTAESSLKIVFGPSWYVFEGDISSDGISLKGTWWDEDDPRKVPVVLNRVTKETAWLPRFKSQFVTVDKNVHLEVLDWGGSGPPLVFLAGRGGTPHSFRKFAPKFVSKYHVYGITRRGFGGSSKPSSGYSTDRLADDVLAVIEELKLNKPVLIGHSAAGREMSSIGSRYPEKVAGLIYLDALNHYSYYDPANGNTAVDALEFIKKLEWYLLQSGLYGAPVKKERETLADLLKSLKGLQKHLRDEQKKLRTVPLPKKTGGEQQASQPSSPNHEQADAWPPFFDVWEKLRMGVQKQTDIRAPILAICASPLERPSGLPDMPTREARWKLEDKDRSKLFAAFTKAYPDARLVEIAHANHMIWISNEEDVLREMNAFLDSLEGSWSAK